MEVVRSSIQENIHVTQNCSTEKCAEFGIQFLNSGGGESLVLNARGRAISKMVTIVEIIKLRCSEIEEGVVFIQTNRIWRDDDRSAAEFIITKQEKAI
jgi:DNA-binding protein